MKRKKGVLVAALAAIVAPLAATLPASATAANNGPVLPDRDPAHHRDAADHRPPPWTPGFIYVDPQNTIESGIDGHVSFTVFGRHLPPAQEFSLSSPSLDAACSGLQFGNHEVPSDLNGRFNFAGFASGCRPGVYMIEATEGAARVAAKSAAAMLAASVGRTYFARVVVEPPRP
ncbi:hypothetical protein NGB36_03640 [Streptomyces sp. RB6PN25]|uniref:Uncharacterized protein n=1 Tax=Streptomyces humicola TaxID=2953240 RepID=A0ABT1PPW0_9ACTN|nr:hypothetical protein [Streptomyces humicola]MCQ4079709.1 hypothetical protein [Streptomyces humicola]